MGRAIATVILAAFLAAATANPAGGAVRAFDGTFAGAGEISFKVKKRKGTRRVVRLGFSGLPVTCASGAQTAGANPLRFSARVNRKGRFRINAQSGNPRNPRSVLRVRGRLKGPRKAAGTLKLRGRAVLTEAGVREECASPKTRWTATSG